MVPIYHAQFKTPSHIKNENGDKWTTGVAAMHLLAKRYAEEHRVNVVMGHTHYPVQYLDGAFSLSDVGDWEDSFSWVEITGDKPRLRRLNDY
jgi:hypothetical protein